MAVQWFECDQKAYLSAAATLEWEGKVAVVHPTETGKSFIVFQLALNQVEKRILRLGPSEYIYVTQLKSLASCGGPDKLSSMIFRTYAKLLFLREEELDMKADYIILDGFHRCGAEQCGNAVQSIIAANPDAKLLGLSATNVRDLDNMRDMADKLFENHIASELSLGESIVRGIWPTPQYVTTLFKYQNELERFLLRHGAYAQDDGVVPYIVCRGESGHAFLHNLFQRARCQQSVCGVQDGFQRPTQAALLHRHAQRGRTCGWNLSCDSVPANHQFNHLQAVDQQCSDRR